jgi:signal transduction histidine kinase
VQHDVPSVLVAAARSFPSTVIHVADLQPDGSLLVSGAWRFAPDAPQPDAAQPDGTAGGFALDPRRELARCEECVATRQPVVFEARRSDGAHESRWHVTLTPILDAGGAVRQLVAVALDLTERSEIEAQLSAAKEAAELASRAKTEFLANMSHELRTPLNAIIGFSQMIRDEYRGPVGRPEYKDYASDIYDSSCHLLDIINDLLDVSKIEAGMLTLHETEFDLGPLVDGTCRLIEPRARDTGIALVVEMERPGPMLHADERMLRQILLNLLSNAVKFTPRGGRVTITAAAAAAGELLLSVRDTGIGIAAEDFERVMQPFGQVESALGRRQNGTGLGLPLTRGFVKLHGGVLALASEVGAGTTVSVRLPGRLVDRPGLE